MNNVNNNNNTTNSSYKERIEQARKQAEKQYNKFKVLLSMMGGGAVLSFALFMTMVRFFDVSHFFLLLLSTFSAITSGAAAWLEYQVWQYKASNVEEKSPDNLDEYYWYRRGLIIFSGAAIVMGVAALYLLLNILAGRI